MRLMWKSSITLVSTIFPYAVAQRFNASSKNSCFQSRFAPRSTGPLEIECHVYIESAAKHQVLCTFDEKGSTGLSGVMSRLIEGRISSSDAVSPVRPGGAASEFFDEVESSAVER
jgi:hypothetical protein